MSSTPFKIAACAALLACGSSQASAAENCVSQNEIRGMAAFVLPGVLKKVADGCAAHVPADSYLRTGFSTLIAEFEAGKEAAWPAAKAAFEKSPSRKDQLKGSSDEAIRTELETSLLAEMPFKLTPRTCLDINQIAEPLAPLGAAGIAAFIAAIFEVAIRDDKDMPSCPRGDA